MTEPAQLDPQLAPMTAPGGHEHLAKPIDLDRLLATVGRLTR